MKAKAKKRSEYEIDLKALHKVEKGNFSFCQSNSNGLRPSETRKQRTVVRIHMRAATLAPMAIAPAVPPRRAEAADFSIISLKESFLGVTSALAELMMKQGNFDYFIVRLARKYR